MLSYDNVKDEPLSFRACTGLDKPEFEKLLIPFRKAWNTYIHEKHIKDKIRKRKYGGGRKPILSFIEEKLFFILFYFKTYPLQEVIALLFDMSQSQANVWIHKLSHVLKMALEEEHLLPERNPQHLEELLAACTSAEFIIDGTERRRQRPKDPQTQKTYYSGKKKAHTYKNNIIVDVHERKIQYMSQTYEGKKHDKKICDEENLTFPAYCILFKDTGFQGYEPPNVLTYQPKKKPKGKEHTEEDMFFNTLISSVRVTIEHVLSGVKRCRIVKDIFRNTQECFADLVMEIACGLHNLRAECRYAKL
jgi:hypothetical protein